jgi:OFA family oxalate/formate antiporter-like MFS transporter
MLYTAKGTGALLVPVAAMLAKNHGWAVVFGAAMTCNVIAALMALFVLKPMRARHFANSRLAYPGPESTSVANPRATTT